MYVLSRQNMVGQYITMQSIMDLCKEMIRRPGTWVTKRWWEQEVIGLVVAQAELAKADRRVAEDMYTEAEN